MSGAEVPLLSGGADLLAEEAAGLQEQLRDADFLCLNTFDFSTSARLLASRWFW